MLTALLVITSPNIEGQNDSLDSDAEPILTSEDLEILTAATRFIENEQAFLVSGEFGGELRMKNGQWIAHGAIFKLTFARPEKLYLYMNSWDGTESRIIFNGKTITMAAYADGARVYDTTPQPGDVNESLDFVTSQGGVNREMANFLTKQLTKSLTDVQSGLSLGKSTIDGVVCDHLAVRTDTRDIQVWIARGHEPTPRRLMITYRNRPGQPRFWVQFEEWILSPELSESTFTYLPPEGAKRVLYFQD